MEDCFVNWVNPVCLLGDDTSDALGKSQESSNERPIHEVVSDIWWDKCVIRSLVATIIPFVARYSGNRVRCILTESTVYQNESRTAYCK